MLTKTYPKSKKSSFVIVLFSLVFWGCSKSKDQSVSAADTARLEPIEVKTTRVIERQVERFVEVVGTLKADQEVVVSSEVKGVIEELPVDLGSVVKRGQVLARLSQKEFKLRVDQAEAALQQVRARLGLRGNSEHINPEQNSEVRQAKAALDEANLRYDRAKTLIKNGDIPQERFDAAEIGYRNAEAHYQASLDNFSNQIALVEQRVAEMQLARKQLNDATILSPLNGAVSQRHVTQGEYIRAETQIVTIVKSNPLRLRAVIPEAAVASVHVNNPLTLSVDSYPGRTFKGVISRVSPSLDEKARTLMVEATVDNQDGTLKPGLFAKVQLLVNKQSPAVMVPSQSVQNFAGLTKVFVLQNDNRIVERVVRTGVKDGDYVEILEGIKVGERIATDRLGKLSNGILVSGKES